MAVESPRRVATVRSNGHSETMQPEIHRDGDDFSLLWPAQGFGMHFDNLKDGRSGITAELTVTYRGDSLYTPDGAPVFWGSVALASPSSRRTVSDAVKGRIEGQWQHFVERGCYLVAREYKQDEPTVVLRNVPRKAGEQHLIEKWLVRDQTNLLVSDHGSGKSFLALAAAVAATAGVSLPSGLRPTRTVKALYCDWEVNAEEHEDRLRAICAGFGIEPPDTIYYRRMNRPLAEAASTLRAEVGRLDVGLVILDSAAYAADGNLIDQDVTTRLTNAARSLGPNVTRLLVAHISKEAAGQKSGRARAFGSTFIEAAARSVWEVRKSDSGEDDSLKLGLFHTKVNSGKLCRPVGLELRFSQGAVAFEPHNVNEDKELAGYNSLPARIREVLKSGAHPVEQIAEALEAKPDTVYKNLRRMSDVFEVERGRKGQPATYGLKDRTHAA